MASYFPFCDDGFSSDMSRSLCRIPLRTMVLCTVARMNFRLTTKSKLQPSRTKSPFILAYCRRATYQTARTTALPPWSPLSRPVVTSLRPLVAQLSPLFASRSRSIFIQTENTPNADVSLTANAEPLDANLEGLEIPAQSFNTT